MSPLPIAAQTATVGVADDPVWAVPAALPQPTPDLTAAASDGALYLLVDDQIAWNGETRLHYAHRALQVTDRAGLEAAATIDWDFAPEFDTLTLTHLSILRDGRETDLRASLQPELLRREQRLEAGILDGSLTAHYVVPDLRVGDVLDYSFVTAEKPALPGSTFAGTEYLEYGSPVALAQLILNWPAGKTLHLGPDSPRVTHTVANITQGGGAVTRHLWQRSGNIPAPIEALTPAENNPDAAVRYSADADWGPLVAALVPYYGADYPLPAAWAARTDRIAAQTADPVARATLALRAVQDEIRYVGLEVGIGGIFARPPETVVTQGFGDCKDKSLLLVTLLKRLGIAAEVALASSDQGTVLPLAQPWIGAFDHMIVRARIGTRTYWMDPTGSHEAGGIDIAPAPDLGYALPVRAGTTTLAAIDGGATTIWQTDTTEAYDFSLLGVKLTVTTHFDSLAANAQRYRFATEPRETTSRDLLDFYAQRYPGLRQILPVRIEDNPDTNRVTTVESYMLPAPDMFANDLWANFVIATEDFGGYYPGHLIGARVAPMTLGSAKHHHHHISIRNAPISFDPPASVRIDNDAFAYRLTGKTAGPGSMDLDWDFRTNRRVVAAPLVAGVIRDARRISETTSLVWNVDPKGE